MLINCGILIHSVEKLEKSSKQYTIINNKIMAYLSQNMSFPQFSTIVENCNCGCGD